MSTPLVMLDDLYPNGIPVRVNWDRWEIGMSLFVPCTGLVRAGTQAREIAARKGYTMVCHPGIEGGHLGVRIWRTT